MARRKVFLTFPQKIVNEPILYEIGRRFEVIPNIKGASVTDEVALLALVLEGEDDEIRKVLAYLENLGVKVESLAGEE
jgi:ABC-type methionine transport system ATPase subunit